MDTLPKDILSASPDVTKDEFVSFMKKAVNRGSPEYRELYFFLVKTFLKVGRGWKKAY